MITFRVEEHGALGWFVSREFSSRYAWMALDQALKWVAIPKKTWPKRKHRITRMAVVYEH
jgi:hypothetical protein